MSAGRAGEVLIPLFALLISPGVAFAQQESAVSLSALAEGLAAGPQTGGKSGNDILNLDIEQLAKTPVVVPSMDIPVTSVTKEESTVGHSAAAVFVITNEMIRRSGATCIPEALRMAPGWTWPASTPTPGPSVRAASTAFSQQSAGADRWPDGL